MAGGDSLSTYQNTTDGVSAVVSLEDRGYVVTFTDTDADAVISIRVYPKDRLNDACKYAEDVVSGIGDNSIFMLHSAEVQ